MGTNSTSAGAIQTRGATKRPRVSFSKLDTYERCPRLFKRRYVELVRRAKAVPLEFGTGVHAALEVAHEEHKTRGVREPVSEDRVRKLWQRHFKDSGLTGVDLYQQGLDMVTGFVRRQGVLDPETLIGIEQRFSFELGDFDVVGVIDRVDRVDDETVVIIDYKSNWVLFTRDEVDASLQLSLYAVAAKKMYPWAKRVLLAFDMLRHNVQLKTERSEADLKAALEYAELLAKRAIADTEYAPKLGKFCGTCDERHDCPAFLRAISGGHVFDTKDPSDAIQIAKERQEVELVRKAASKRRDALDVLLKEHLKECESIPAGDDVEFVMFNREMKRYPLGDTVATLAEASGKSAAEITESIAVVEKKSLDKFVSGLREDLGKSKVLLMKAELDAKAKKTKSPSLWARKVRR